MSPEPARLGFEGTGEKKEFRFSVFPFAESSGAIRTPSADLDADFLDGGTAKSQNLITGHAKSGPAGIEGEGVAWRAGKSDRKTHQGTGGPLAATCGARALSKPDRQQLKNDLGSMERVPFLSFPQPPVMLFVLQGLGWK